MQLFPITCLLILAVTTGWASASPPRQPRAQQYARLWTASPFTIKPTAIAKASVSPLERDWSLGSIVPLQNGYAVTLINKKDRKDRIRFIPGFSTGEFKLIEVKQNTVSRKESRVLVSKGTQKGWITYDEKVVSLRVSGAAKTSAKKTAIKGKSSRGGPPVPGKKPTKTPHRTRHVPRTK